MDLTVCSTKNQPNSLCQVLPCFIDKNDGNLTCYAKAGIKYVTKDAEKYVGSKVDPVK